MPRLSLQATIFWDCEVDVTLPLLLRSMKMCYLTVAKLGAYTSDHSVVVSGQL